MRQETLPNRPGPTTIRNSSEEVTPSPLSPLSPSAIVGCTRRGVSMPPSQSNRTTKAVPRRQSRTGEAESARIAASAYIVGNYPIGFLGGTPQRLTLEGRPFWIVPIVLTSPGYGAVGEVG